MMEGVPGQLTRLRADSPVEMRDWLVLDGSECEAREDAGLVYRTARSLC